MCPGDLVWLPQLACRLFPPRFTLPTMYDLSSEAPEEPGLLDEFHFYLEIGSAWIN